MKNTSLILLVATGLLFSQCTKTSEVTPKEEIDYDQESVKIMQELSPVVVGDWSLRRVQIKAQPHNYGQKQLRLVRDTVFQDFATLSIKPEAPRQSVVDLRYPAFEGSLHFKSKSYPIRFELMANPERVVHQQGPQALFLLQYNFPVGSHPTEPERTFLENLGFISENFSLEVLPNQPDKMIWRGLNRGIDNIELIKR